MTNRILNSRFDVITTDVATEGNDKIKSPVKGGGSPVADGQDLPRQSSDKRRWQLRGAVLLGTGEVITTAAGTGLVAAPAKKNRQKCTHYDVGGHTCGLLQKEIPLLGKKLSAVNALVVSLS